MLAFLICLFGFILLTKAFENVYIPETDNITLVCPRIASSLDVTFSDGSSEWYGDFKANNCATYKTMTCAQDAEANTLSVPVSNITRNIVSYSCGGLSYSVQFYAVSKGVKCRKPDLTENGTSISFSCTVNKIYPQLECSLQDTVFNLTYVDVHYERLESHGSPVYYKETCTFFMDVSKLRLGDHKFQAYVRPKGVASAGQVQIISPNIKLAPIKTKLEAPCPRGPNVRNGYIKAGTDAYCVCQNQGKSFGTVYFSNESIRHSIKGSLGSLANVSVTYPKDHEQTFYCRAAPLEDNAIASKFKAVFAFGPSNLHLSKASIKLKLCSNATLTASAPSDTVNPGATFECSPDNPKALIITQVSDAISNFSSSFVLKALLPGKFILTCRGFNVIFKEFHSEAHIVVVVEANESVQPKITINRGNTLKENAESVTVTCTAGEVSNLTFSCFNQTLLQTTRLLSIDHNLTREDNGQICSCTSEYSCYETKTVEAPIYLAYGPSEMNVLPTVVKMGLCKEEKINLSVQETDAFPGINFNMSVDVPNSLSWEQSAGNFTATFQLKAQRAGEFNVTITATNAYDENIRVESVVRVTVQDSKRFKPVLLINNGSATIEGSSTQDVLITCRAPIPGNISSISLSCLGTNVTSSGAELVISKNLSRSQNGERCRCQVWYDPYCDYIETTLASINVTYAANISSFFVNSNKTTIVVDQGENITLNCVVASNPKPEIRIVTESVTGYLSQQVYTTTIKESKQDSWTFNYEIQNADCRKSSTYTCLASNRLTPVDVRHSATVAVRCKAQLLGPATLEFELNSDRVGTASVDLLSYPKPNIFTVFSPNRGQLIDGKDYTVGYIETTFFSGKLIVIMDKPNEDKLTSYKVNVSNGIGNDLQFEFSFVQASKSLIDSTTLITIVAVASFAAVVIIVVVLYCKCKQCKSSENRADVIIKEKPKVRQTSASRYITGLFSKKKKKIEPGQDCSGERRINEGKSEVNSDSRAEIDEDLRSHYDEIDEEEVSMHHTNPELPRKKNQDISLSTPLMSPTNTKTKAKENFSNKKTSVGQRQSVALFKKSESSNKISLNQGQGKRKVPPVRGVTISKTPAQSPTVNETPTANKQVKPKETGVERDLNKSYGDLKGLGKAPSAPNFRTEKSTDTAHAQENTLNYANIRIIQEGPPSINSVSNESYTSDKDLDEMKESCQATVGSQDDDPEEAVDKTDANTEIPSQGECIEHTNPKTLANALDNDPHQTRPKTLAITERSGVPNRYSKISIHSPTAASYGTTSLKINEEEQTGADEEK